MHVRIFKPAKTAMQSGRAKTKDWCLVFEPQDPVSPDPIMGWNGSSDTSRQVKLEFETKEDAVEYAKNKGYTYTVMPANERRIKPKAYSDNFAHERRRPWTH